LCSIRHYYYELRANCKSPADATERVPPLLKNRLFSEAVEGHVLSWPSFLTLKKNGFMSKNKDKHHPPEAADKNAAAPDNLSGDDKTVQAPPEHPPKPALESPEEGLAKSEEEIARLKDQLLRLRADFENYRKRALREKGEIYENANEALMLDLLPIIDHLQLALKSAREHPVLASGERSRASQGEASTDEPGKGQAHQTFQQGIQMIFDQLLNTLLKYGLNPFNSEKQPFDPNLHEAISCLPSETEPEGTIIVQNRPGYRFHDKMLRPAQVVVSSGPAKAGRTEASDQPLEE